MAWTSPRTWVAGEVVTAAELNTHVRDNLTYVHDNPCAPWTHIESTGDFGAAPDTNYRVWTNATITVDTHSDTSWITASAQMRWVFPTADAYLISFGFAFPNQEGGTAACFLSDMVTGAMLLAARATIGTGNDPSANLARSGITGGPFVFRPIAGRTYGLGGYWNGGTGTKYGWMTAHRVGA